MKYSFLIRILFLILSVSSCSTTETNQYTWQNIYGRDSGNQDRFPLYRAKIPHNWIRIDTPISESLIDTKKPICEFAIVDSISQEKIRVTVHNFPSYKIEERIPPQAQIQRWIRQFDSMNALNTSVTPQSRGGYIGLQIIGEGLINNSTEAIMGWAMQLAVNHYHQFGYSDAFSVTELVQKRSDYTIKATGPISSMEQNADDILLFANSFELIDEIPAP